MRGVVFGVFLLIAVPLVAVARIPRPTFEEVHTQFMRLTANESGFISVPDQDGILQSMSIRARKPDGTLDLPGVLLRMTKHSPRTFPPGSRFRTLISTKRLRYLDRTRNYHNKWASTLTLDCAPPSAWDEKRHRWAVVEERCKRLVETTRKLLTGEDPGQCKGNPDTWGSAADVSKRHIRKMGWQEVKCDRRRTAVDCDALRRAAATTKEGRRRLANSTECARNTYWDWG